MADGWSIVSDRSLDERIDGELRHALARRNRQARNARESFVAREGEARTVGGVVVSASYGWLHVEALWVEEAARGRGLGRALMARAFEFGGACDCHGVWLDTSNPDAMAFYQRLGFEVFGELANSDGQFPPEHRRWFLKRAIG